MSNFGIGIGSFLEGLTKGAQIRNQMDQRDAENAIAERKLKLLEGRDVRDAESDALNLKKTQADLDYTTSERAAQAPVLKAQRDATLTGLQDDAEMRSTFRTGSEAAKKDYESTKAKSILIGDNRFGPPTLTVDGRQVASKDDAEKLFEQRHGAFMDSYRTKVFPQIVQGYLKRGDIKSAEAFEKWNQQKGVENAVHDYGRMMQSFAMGDWDGVNKHLNGIVKNGDYVALDRRDIKAEPIKGDGDKTVGIRVKFKDKTTNSESSRDFNDMDEFHQFAAVMAAPDAAFEQGKADLEATRAAKAEKAKSQNKLANDIELKQVKSAGRIAEERAKTGTLSAKDYQTEILGQLKVMTENDDWLRKDVVDKNGNVTRARMSSEEAVAAAADRVDQALARTGQRSQGAGSPAGRSIFQSSQTGAAAQVAPVRRRPAIFSRPNPTADRVRREDLLKTFPLFRSGEQAAQQVAPPAGQEPIEKPLTVDQQYARKHGLPLYFSPDDVDAVLRQRSGRL